MSAMLTFWIKKLTWGAFLIWNLKLSMGAGGSKENEDKVVKIKTVVVDPNQGSRSTIVAVN